jgi:hypothetical protein
MRTGPLLLLPVLLLTAPAAQANKLIAPGFQKDIADGGFAATTEREWNRLSDRDGKYQEIWTIDGTQLNAVTFYGGVPLGRPLVKERDKKNQPLPKVQENMLVTDIPTLLETTYRALSPGTRIVIGRQEPVDFSGGRGIRFEYTFVSVDDDVERRAEAVGTFRNGRLYLVTYEAPTLYFYDKAIGTFRHLVGSLTIRSRSDGD